MESIIVACRHAADRQVADPDQLAKLAKTAAEKYVDLCALGGLNPQANAVQVYGADLPKDHPHPFLLLHEPDAEHLDKYQDAQWFTDGMYPPASIQAYILPPAERLSAGIATRILLGATVGWNVENLANSDPLHVGLKQYFIHGTEVLEVEYQDYAALKRRLAAQIRRLRGRGGDAMRSLSPSTVVLVSVAAYGEDEDTHTDNLSQLAEFARWADATFSEC